MTAEQAVKRIEELEASADTLDLEGARAHYVSAMFALEQALKEDGLRKKQLTALQSAHENLRLKLQRGG